MIESVGIIGSGNLAWHLAPALYRSGIRISQIISRRIKNAKELAVRVDAQYSASLHNMTRETDLWIIAVPDDAIAGVALSFPFLPERVVHTSGSVDLDVLEGTGFNTGVFYPLQTFSKNRPVDFEKIPVFLESDQEDFLEELANLASRISEKVIEIDSEQRTILHIAAVFACNYTNALYAIAKDLLNENGLKFKWLHPLIKETVQKAIENGPDNAQTGPAIRNDKTTIAKHLELLDNEKYRELYKLFADIIGERFSLEE